MLCPWHPGMTLFECQNLHDDQARYITSVKPRLSNDTDEQLYPEWMERSPDA
jgi:hypothetical protein